ncbi:MAG: hypothetical protein ACI8UD_001433 [Planctomycetota bacterium]|jgi:hypothetical protein
MLINDVLARDKAPRSTTSTSELVRTIARKFEQELARVVGDVGCEDLTAMRFEGFLSDLKSTLADIGCETIEQVLESRDSTESRIVRDGEVLRYRESTGMHWLTSFGRVKVMRRVYRADGGGAGSFAPLDDACGMRDRFMTPDVEEMVAFGAAMLTANEVAQLLAKTLPAGPSTTAIQNVVLRLGTEIEDQRVAIELGMESESPLSCEGDTLVVSWDGVMTPLREPTKVAWREAGVATVSIYGEDEKGPVKLDTRYYARMPEKGMKTLLEQVVDQVARAGRNREFREFAVICDGKDTIWNAAAAHPEFQDAVWILDFYHAAENLMKAAKAIFGDDEVGAARWHKKIRGRLLREPNGADSAIRSMRRYRKSLRKGSKACKVVHNAIKYFCYHRDRMCYFDFVSMGLPIGSGPVESAAKNIVQARLKRSGMRWSRSGGQHVLNLRTYLKSNRWDVMWSTITKAA